MPGSGRKAHQLNWALRPETLGVTLGEGYDPRRVYVGVSDADSLPDRNVYRWMAAEVLAGRGAPAYQGVTLSLANFVAQDGRGRVCAIQQSSIFIRVSIARLINEARRLRWFARLTARAPRVGRAIRPVFEFCFRRSQICLGHNQFVRLDVLQAIGGFPTSGATEDCIEDVARHLERPLDVRRTTLRQRLVGTFRCQTYWLLATRGAWRVLWMLARQRRFDPPKTDRVTR